MNTSALNKQKDDNMNYRKALGTSIIMMIVRMSPIVLSVIITVAANNPDLETYTVTLAYLIGAILCIPVADKGLKEPLIKSFLSPLSRAFSRA